MNSSAKQILIGWIYRRIGFLKRGIKKQIKPLAAILRFLDFSIPPYRHFERSREIFLALCSFLLLSRKDSPSLLSHIRRYTGVQERSLHFARDDVAEVAFFQHIRCTLREINPFPPYRHEGRSQEILLALCSFLLLSQKVSPFPLSHIRRYTGVQERFLHFGRDDDTGIALSKHIRCTLREINPFPHTVISSAVEKSSLHSALSCSFRRSILVFCYHTYGAIPVCKKDRGLRSG